MKEPTIADIGGGAQAHSQKNYRETYNAYIQSDHWRNLRAAAISKAGYVCEACENKRPLDGHHLLYREPLESGIVEDIMSLCRPCHDIWHDWLNSNGKKPHYFDRGNTKYQIQELLKQSKERASDVSFTNHIALHLNEHELASYNRFYAQAPKGGHKAKRNYALKRTQKLHGRSLAFLKSGSAGKKARKAKKVSFPPKPKPKQQVVPEGPKYKLPMNLRPKIDILEDVIFEQGKIILKLQQQTTELVAQVDLLRGFLNI